MPATWQCRTKLGRTSALDLGCLPGPCVVRVLCGRACGRQEGMRQSAAAGHQLRHGVRRRTILLTGGAPTVAAPPPPRPCCPGPPWRAQHGGPFAARSLSSASHGAEMRNDVFAKSWNGMQCSVSCVIQCHVMSCHVMSCHVMQCNIMRCNAIQ